MRHIYLLWTVIGTLIISLPACKTKKQILQNSEMETSTTPATTGDEFAIIDIQNNNQVFGPITKGEKVSGSFQFINSGDVPLDIELASACTCTELDWPRSPVPPGSEAVITFTYDSSKKDYIDDHRDMVTIDIVANTDPIVTEAFFTVHYKE